MIENKVETEVCHYCERRAEYNDISKDKPWRVVGVCPKHLVNYTAG